MASRLPISPDGVVNAEGQAEVTSNDSTAVRAEDSSVKQTTLPHGVESTAAVPTKDLGPANTKKRKTFIEHLVHMIYELSKRNLRYIFYGGLRSFSSDEEQTAFTEQHRSELELCLQQWREKAGKCNGCHSFEPWNNCLPCINEQQCISFTGAREFFKHLKDEQIEIICENFKLAFNKSVCINTRIWDNGWRERQP